MHSKMVVATIAAVTLGAVGCGSSGPLTSAELTKQANAICKHRTAEIATLRKQHARDFRGLVVAALPVYAKSVDDLRGLKPPDSAKASYNRFVATQDATVAQIKRIKAGKPADRAGSASTAEAGPLAEKLGFSACR